MYARHMAHIDPGLTRNITINFKGNRVIDAGGFTPEELYNYLSHQWDPDRELRDLLAKIKASP